MGVFSHWIEAGTVVEFAETDRKMISVDEQPFLLVKVDKEFFAVSSMCTHAQAMMIGGTIEGFELECPLHGARFDVRDGSVLSPPATRGLKTIAVKVVDGKIMVRG